MPTVKMNMETIERFKNEYDGFLKESPNEYILYFFQTKGASVSIYKSGKAVFQGSNLEIFSEYIKVDQSESYPYDKADTIGADEVGTGDIFGPIVCASAYVKAKDTEKLKKNGVKDSKKISDETILKLGKYLTQNFKYKANIVRNETFNDKQKDYNLNAMKALLHNQNITDLAKEVKYDMVCLDQFCSKENYFSYIKGNAFKDISFEMKGESKSISVAAASIIARYLFLMEMNRLKELYGYELPKGSGEAANKMIEKIKEDGKEKILYHIAKLSFKNFK